jgi:hypothetical protein
MRGTRSRWRVLVALLRGLRGILNQTYGAAGDMPSYRAVLDREGLGTIGDTAIVGNESVVAKRSSVSPTRAQPS